MYGGYGNNIWNQGGGGAQWPTASNQMAQAQQFQQAQMQQQQSLMGYGGQQMANLANPAAAGMMGQWGAAAMGNMGANPFMNYGNVAAAAGFGMQPVTTAPTAATWMTNQQQQYQMQQSFPGGRPPLPPGPPPDTPPKNNAPQQQMNQNQRVLFNNSNPNQNPPPPPPPPPPSQNQQSSHLLPGTNINLDDALNIIKGVPAYGNLPSGPLAIPLTSLNVSEELFGSKKNSSGIPGLDVAEDKPPTPKGPEVVDLEEEAKKFEREMAGIQASNSNQSTENQNKPNLNRDSNSGTGFSDKNEKTNNGNGSNNENNGVRWELRPDVKSQEWNNSGPGRSRNSRFDDNPWGSANPENNQQKSTENRESNDENTGKKEESESGKRVEIPLESGDGKELVYDRKTLKQFDQKFREWENQFEDWKKQNQHHPNKATYKQYLDQWESWREQLIEQRRSILEKMTKAKLDCKEIILAKIEEMEAGDNGMKPGIMGEKPSFASQPKDGGEHSKANKDIPISKPNEKNQENPFEAALRDSEPVRRPFAPATATSDNNKNENTTGGIPGIPPLIPGLKAGGRDRPVERIERNAGSNRDRGSRNTFGQQEDSNPFMMNSGNQFDTKDNLKDKKNNEFESDSKMNLPFEWTLSSQNKPETNNPFDVGPPASKNPFNQPSGPNPFDIKPEQRLPSLNDFLKQTNLDFSGSSGSSKQHSESSNPFVMPPKGSAESGSSMRQNQEPQFDRILRDPQQTSTSNNANTSAKPMRLAANPVGMPLLVAAKDDSPKRNNEDDYSHLFSRDRGPVHQENDNSNFDDDNYNMEDAEVIDYGAGGNSMDSMDFPRGENPDDNQGDDGDDPDFSLEDTEVIDYSQGVPPQEAGMYGDDAYGGYQEEYDNSWGYGQGGRGGVRGGYSGRPEWGRGHPRGAPGGGHAPYGRGGAPQHFAPDFSRGRGGRGGGRGMGRGYNHAPPPEWFNHDDRTGEHVPPYGGPVPEDPDVIELSPSPEPAPAVHPGIRIAPPNPDVERVERRRSRSRDRGARDRSRSRSRERSRRGGGRDDSSRRDRDRRGRFDDSRDQRRYRDSKDRRGRSKSRSRSPVDTNTIVRNPLFPSASQGLLGAQRPASNPPAPRYQTVLIEDILNTPGRSKRPPRLVIFLRGLPGSGKSHIVKLIKEREVEMGGKAPRILSLDNYFITEIEKKEKDPATGAEVKKTVMEYEFDEEREPLYRAQLVRQFKKTLDEGYFSFVVVDCVNEYVRQFEEMAAFATQKRFQVYVAEIEESVETCVKRNIHKRTRDEILKINRNWERTPGNFIKLDTRTLLQDEAIQEVEMEDVSDVEADNEEKTKPPTPAERGKIGPQVVDLEDIEDDDSGDQILMSSKWDTTDPSQEKLNKMDGLLRRKRANSEEAHVESAPSIDAWLTSNMPEDYVQRRPTQPGQKRVRWADIEERRQQERMREVGFVVGQTDWKRMMDPTFGSSALTKTKFF